MGETSYGKCRYLSVNWEFSKILRRYYTFFVGKYVVN
jgi:hypothetical protein